MKSESHSVGDGLLRPALQLRQAYAKEQRAGVDYQYASGKVGGNDSKRFNSRSFDGDSSSDPTSATCVGTRRTATNKFLSGARGSMSHSSREEQHWGATAKRPVWPLNYTTFHNHSNAS